LFVAVDSIKFIYTDQIFILIETPYPTSQIQMWEREIVTLHYYGNSYNIFDDFHWIGDFIENFYSDLTAILEKKLILDFSITQDIGFLWNELLQGKRDGLICDSDDN